MICSKTQNDRHLPHREVSIFLVDFAFCILNSEFIFVSLVRYNAI